MLKLAPTSMVSILGKSLYVTFTILAALWAWAWVSAAIAPMTWPTQDTWDKQPYIIRAFISYGDIIE